MNSKVFKVMLLCFPLAYIPWVYMGLYHEEVPLIQVSAELVETDTLVIISHFETVPARNNLDFFLKYGMLDERVYVLLIINGEATINFQHPRLKYRHRENRGHDMCAYKEAITDLGDDINKYKYLFLINTSVRGPILPTYYDVASWSSLYKFNFHRHLSVIGTSANCMLPCPNCGASHRFKIYPQFHVQSMMWGMERNAIPKMTALLQCLDQKSQVIEQIELRATVFLEENAVLTSPLQMNFKYMPPNDPFAIQRACDMHERDDGRGGNIAFDDKGIDHVRLHPFELIFHKTGHDGHRILHQQELINRITAFYNNSKYAATTDPMHPRRPKIRDKIVESDIEYHLIVAVLPNVEHSNENLQFVAKYGISPQIHVVYVYGNNSNINQFTSNARSIKALRAPQCATVACAWKVGLDHIKNPQEKMTFLMTNEVIGPFLPAYGRDNWRQILGDSIPNNGVLFSEAGCSSNQEIYAHLRFAGLHPQAFLRFSAALEKYGMKSLTEFSKALLSGDDSYRMPVEFISFQWNSQTADSLLLFCNRDVEILPSLPVDAVFVARDGEENARAINLYIKLAEQEFSDVPLLAPRKSIRFSTGAKNKATGKVEFVLEKSLGNKPCIWSNEENSVMRCMEFNIFWDWHPKYAQIPLYICGRTRIDNKRCSEGEEATIVGWVSDGFYPSTPDSLKRCNVNGQLFVDHRYDCSSFDFLGYVKLI